MESQATLTIRRSASLIAVLTQAVREGFRRDGSGMRVDGGDNEEKGGGNVRCLRSLRGMKKVMEENGWVVER